MSIRTRRGRWLGAFPSKPNPNDLGFPAHLIKRAGDFPPQYTLAGKVGKVKDQGQQGSCTAHGATSEGETLYLNFKGAEMTFSPAFHYYLERQLEGTLSQGDCGANVDTSLVIAQNQDPSNVNVGGFGFCPESSMPYSDSDFSTAPSADALTAALLNPGGSHHSIGNNIANMKSCILSGYTFVIGISVYDSFESDDAANTGMIPYPNLSTENLQGGHETHAGIGWDDTLVMPGTTMPGAIMCQNSWGTGWGTTCPITGERGFYWLPYAFLMDPNLTSDVRMQHLGKPW